MPATSSYFPAPAPRGEPGAQSDKDSASSSPGDDGGYASRSSCGTRRRPVSTSDDGKAGIAWVGVRLSQFAKRRSERWFPFEREQGTGITLDIHAREVRSGSVVSTTGDASVVRLAVAGKLAHATGAVGENWGSPRGRSQVCRFHATLSRKPDSSVWPSLRGLPAGEDST
jgi:hypothetical protein